MDKITPEALLIAASGIVIVFLVLAMLCFMIPIVSRLVRAFTEEPVEQAQPPQQPVETPKPVATAPIPAAYGGDIMLIDVDEKTAVCVMAIVSHETGIPLSELIFKKIKAL